MKRFRHSCHRKNVCYSCLKRQEKLFGLLQPKSVTPFLLSLPPLLNERLLQSENFGKRLRLCRSRTLSTWSDKQSRHLLIVLSSSAHALLLEFVTRPWQTTVCVSVVMTAPLCPTTMHQTVWRHAPCVCVCYNMVEVLGCAAIIIFKIESCF